MNLRHCAPFAACVLCALGAVAGGCTPENGRPPALPPEESSPEAGSEVYSEARPFDSTLVDITAESGIRFRHVTGGYGEKLLPETMGSGCALLDFDGDGRLDVFFVNGTWWPNRERPDERAPTCALYRGRGDGSFDDVTDSAGCAITLYGMGASVADYDGDGDDDLYVTGVGRNVLLRNESGRFSDVTAAAGVTAGTWSDREGREFPEWSTASGWSDVDLDGDVDLIVGNYVEWTVEGEIFTTIDGVTKAFTTPDRYNGLPPRLFLNRGDGTFEDATLRSGLGAHRGKALAMAFWDFDQNGYMDIAIANDTRPNFLLLNRGGAVFEEVGLRAGLAYDETGRARAGMGIDVADYMNSGVPGVAIANFSEEPISLYRWQEDGTFSSEATRAGIAQPTYMPLAFGIRLVDIDLDGVLDIIVANGHIEPDVSRVFQNQSYPQSPQLFHGRAFGRFEDVSTRTGTDFQVPRVARALAAGDLDGDGDLDFVLTTREGPAVIFRNDRGTRDPNRFLRVRLHGKDKNTKALGSTVKVTVGDVTQTRVARTGSSYLSESEMTLTFGLGASTKVDRLEVRWPTGETRVVPVDGVDRTVDIREEE